MPEIIVKQINGRKIAVVAHFKRLGAIVGGDLSAYAVDNTFLHFTMKLLAVFVSLQVTMHGYIPIVRTEYYE